MKSWWNSLSQRERLLVGIGGASLLLMMIYWGAWRPFSNSIETAEQQLSKQREALSWMQLRAGDLRQQPAGARQPDRSTTLEAVANTTSRQLGVSLTRLQPTEQDLLVELQVLEFERLMNWLVVMERDYGVSVKVIELAAEGGKGMVRVRRLQLGRPS